MYRAKTGAALILTLLLAGCGGTAADRALQAQIQDIHARHKGNVEPLPEIKPYENFIYTAHELRPPFDIPDHPQDPAQQVAESGSGISPDFDRRKESLEQFPLAALSMTGTLAMGDNLWAIVVAPDKTVNRVGLGNYMGQNHGRIVDINEQTVTLAEIVSNGANGWTEREAAISIVEE
ncbi:MAG: pilus assembly protein PilP [Gammaproteobacteria bacterium]|nr:pilus assembly protein PilP [Gammaproteobacteria bacterium]